MKPTLIVSLISASAMTVSLSTAVPVSGNLFDVTSTEKVALNHPVTPVHHGGDGSGDLNGCFVGGLDPQPLIMRCQADDGVPLGVTGLGERYIRLIPSVGVSLPMSKVRTAYHVATTGSDADPGSAERPFRTIQKAADTARAGDVVHVHAGVYSEAVRITTAGEPDRPIVFEGERNAAGEWTTILDRSVPVKGWVPAPEIGPGVFKTEALDFVPYSMTLDHRQLARVHDRFMEDGKGFEYLRAAVDAPCFDEMGETRVYGANKLTFWDGLEALYACRKGVVYIRFRKGDDPNALAVRAAPEGAGFEIRDGSHVIIRRFLVRGARDSVVVAGPRAVHNLIEENYLINGHNRVVLTEGAAHNIVRGNEMTLGYYSNDDLGAWGTAQPDRRTALRLRAYRVFKLIVGPTSSDDHGVLVRGAGEGNEIDHNHIFNGLIGISCGSSRALKVHHNVIHNMSSIGLLTSEDGRKGVVDGEFYENLLYDCNINVRLHHYNNCLPGERREFHYRNFSWQPKGMGSHIFVHWTEKRMTPGSAHPEIFLYQNTYAGGDAGLRVSGWADDDGGVPGLNVLNNVFATPVPLGVNTALRKDPKAMGLFDHNWLGGVIPDPLPVWLGAHNVYEKGKSLWPAESMPDFVLPTACAARAAGLDLSKRQTLGGRTFGPMPGMKPGYFAGAAPDGGALQEGERAGVPLKQP